MGDFIPAKLGFDEGEQALYMAYTLDFSGYMLYFFENGKAAKVELSCYQTKTNRKKLVNAYSDSSPIAGIAQISEDTEFLLTSSAGRMLLLHTGSISVKTTRNSQGIFVMTLKKNQMVKSAVPFKEEMLANAHRYRAKKIPAAGMLLREEDQGEQLKLD